MNSISFPSQLYRLLQMLEDNDMSHIASWQPHGRAFLVHDKAEFVSKVMPSAFRQTKYSSFQRQLNIYGFKRITCGIDQNAYYHEHFLRGEYTSTLKIRRIALKGTGTRLSTNREEEPNFYQMPYKFDVGPSNERSTSVQVTTQDSTTVPLQVQARGMNVELTAKFITGVVPCLPSYATSIPSIEAALWQNGLTRLPLNATANECPYTTIPYLSTAAGRSSNSFLGTRFRPLLWESSRDLTVSTVAAILREQALIEVIEEALRLNS